MAGCRAWLWLGLFNGPASGGVLDLFDINNRGWSYCRVREPPRRSGLACLPANLAAWVAYVERIMASNPDPAARSMGEPVDVIAGITMEK